MIDTVNLAVQCLEKKDYRQGIKLLTPLIKNPKNLNIPNMPKSEPWQGKWINTNLISVFMGRILGIATEYLENKDHQTAIELLSIIINKHNNILDEYDPNTKDMVVAHFFSDSSLLSDTHFTRGSAYFYGTEDLNKSWYDYNQAIVLGKNTPDAYLQRGKVYHYLAMDRLDEYKKKNLFSKISFRILKDKDYYFNRSIQDYNKTLLLDPSCSIVYHLKGKLYRLFKKYDMAIDCFTAEMGLDNKHIEPIIERGKTFYYMKKYKSAIKDLNSAIKTQPDDEASRYINYCYEEKNHYYSTHSEED